ncbi:uncharacterized protein [Sinocyclocheilus grahami]|uniref:uncharacterized protein n=1 Tax=Sinocyclocheilus grahami TaxID=75366 RepID=UPI0007AD3059|nr:PREDICTED: uncharacterized protein LOC107566429 [Sinocyclocheilus grahami]
MEGDSVTLQTGVKTNQQEKIKWYFNDIRIAQISVDQSKTCTDVQCKRGDERFRGRLKLDKQTGSLTITNTRTSDAGLYKLQIISSRISIMKKFSFTVASSSGIKWYFNDTRIAQINGDQTYICTDVQCNVGTERFRDRLKLDNQTGSLTIMNIRNAHSGLYQLEIISDRISIMKHFSVFVRGESLCLKTCEEEGKMNQNLLPYFFMKLRFILTSVFLFAHGVSAVETDVLSVSVMEGDSITLNTGFESNQQEYIIWYFDDNRIALITGDLGKICTDVQCNEGTERFRDRLKLDHQTGSLTITNTTTTDAGLYELKIISIRKSSEKTFNVTVHDVPANERDQMQRKSVKEGESVTLDPGVMKNPEDLMMWYFNDICIAEITGDPSKICTDDQCDEGTERFRDRLQLGHQTGSLTIMNINTTHSGLYKLQITSSRISIIRSFSVSVIGKYHFVNDVVDLSPNQSEIPLMDDANERSSNHTDALGTNTTNDSPPNRIESEAASEI